MELNTLRYALIGALTTYGPMYCQQCFNVKPVVTSELNEEILTVSYRLGLALEFKFDLDCPFAEGNVELFSGDNRTTLNFRVPSDCHENDVHIVLNRMLETLFLRIKVEYKKALET